MQGCEAATVPGPDVGAIVEQDLDDRRILVIKRRPMKGSWSAPRNLVQLGC